MEKFRVSDNAFFCVEGGLEKLDEGGALEDGC